MSDLRRSRTEESTRRAKARSRSRPRSRPGSREPPLHRLLSSQFPDDHSVYHHEDGEGVHVDEDAESIHRTETERRASESSDSDSDSSDAVENEKDEPASPAEGEETTIQEIKGGIPNEHDVEANPPALQKKKSSRSIKDPNLVCRNPIFRFIRADFERLHGTVQTTRRIQRTGPCEENGQQPSSSPASPSSLPSPHP